MMTVIVTNETPAAIRGLLKRWFIEPKPHVFVGTVNRRVRNRVIEYVRRNAPELGMLIISTDNTSQGFYVESFGDPDRRPTRICGLHLIAEEWKTEEPLEKT